MRKLFTSRAQIFILVMVAFLWRVYLNEGIAHRADALTIGKMAFNIANGIDFPLIYYGQNYMGAIEAWITAPLFFIFGPSWEGLGFAPVLVSSLGVIPFYLLGRSLIGERTGLICGLLWAFTSFAPLFYSISPRGGYPEIVCGGTFLLWFCVERMKGRDFSVSAHASIGFLMGLLLWTSALSAPYLAVTALFLIFTRNRGKIIALFVGAIPGFLLALPQLLATRGEATLSFGDNSINDRLSGLYYAFSESFIPFDGHPWLWATPVVMVISLLAVSIYSLRNLKGERGGFLPLLLFALLFLTAFMLNNVSVKGQSRHLIPLFSALIPATALIIDQLWRWRIIPALLLLLLIVSSNLFTGFRSFSDMKEEGAAVKEGLSELYSAINRLNIHSLVLNNYDKRNRLSWHALTEGGRIDTMGYDGARELSTTKSAERDRDTALGISLGYGNAFAMQYRACCGDNYKLDKVPGLVLLHHARPERGSAESIPPANWNLTPDLTALGDRNFFTTKVGSGSFTVELNDKKPLSRVRVIYGRKPSTASISVSMDGEVWRVVAIKNWPSIFVPTYEKVFIRTDFEREREFEEWNFSPVEARYVRFDLTTDPGKVYDIHELFLYRKAARPPSATELDPALVHKTASTENVKLLAVNRWHSAHLIDLERTYDLVTGPFRGYAKETAKSRWPISPGFSALVENSDMDELRNRLTEKGIKFKTAPLGRYTFLSILSEGADVWWTGFTLIDYIDTSAG